LNYRRKHKVGVDVEIDSLQKYLYDNIVCKWNLDDFNGYGRVYKNKRNKLIIPEYYVSEKEYKEVLLDDRLNGIMFFSTSNFAKTYGTLLVQDVDIIFTFNLSSLQFCEEREDEYIRQYIYSLMNQYSSKQEVKQITTGLNNVYSDYNGVADYFFDMQDFHHFKITTEIRYFNKNCI